jgi:ABC-type lipoprotein release transport system permease subunit
MAIPLIYNVRSLRQRPISTLATATGMAIVVAVFIGVMALAKGFAIALAHTGSTDNAIVLRQGANNEMSSGLSRETAEIIQGMPFVARDGQGRPLASPEVYVVVNLERVGGGLANVVARGVSPQAFAVRKGIRITEGRMFRSGAPEILIGKTIVGRFPNTGIGEKILFANREWTVVGHFEAQGSSFESEIWGENEQFMPAFRGEVFQSLTFRMKDPAAFEGIKQTLQKDPRLQVDVEREYDFYANQSTQLTKILEFFAVFVTAIMAIGAVAGALNTMYAAVANRAPEIGVLRTLGFRPFSVVGCFLLEALLIALVGGLVGCMLALPINGITTSTTNWSSFSELAFPFRVTPDLLALGLAFAVVMGFVGGLLPAIRAARMPIVQALRLA